MARDTKQPGVLRELFEALGNDPVVIAECLARPILTARLIADFSAQDQTRHVESTLTDAGARSVETISGRVVYTLPEIVDTCTDDTWTATTTANAPRARYRHTAVWTGTEMIVWGGYGVPNSGGRYNPSTDSWTATSRTNAPVARIGHTAVWTGNEMIVWGGYTGNTVPLITGGRYNPNTNSWIATGTTNAPPARYGHTAVWTGSEMIVWGGAVAIPGRPPATNTGGKYNPGTNSWIATSRINAPFRRAGGHTAVWTGSEMIVWAGSSGVPSNTGARYCAQAPRPPLTVIQPNGGEVWTAGSVQQITWNGNLKHTDHLIIQYSRDGGANWFRIARDIPAFTVGYWWQVDNFPTTQGRVKILLQENLSIIDQSDANFTVQRGP